MGEQRQRERVRDRFSNGVKLPSLLTRMIIGRENFIERIFILFFSFFSFFLVPFSSLTRGSRRGQARNSLIERKEPSRLSRIPVFLLAAFAAGFFPARIAVVAFSSLSREYRGNPNLCFSRYNLLILRI